MLHNCVGNHGIKETPKGLSVAVNQANENTRGRMGDGDKRSSKLKPVKKKGDLKISTSCASDAANHLKFC